jgi:hypothetical protein
MLTCPDLGIFPSRTFFWVGPVKIENIFASLETVDMGNTTDKSMFDRASKGKEYDDVYEGEWKDDTRHGWGKSTYANGDIYEGEWKNNKRHGHGEYTRLNGSVYEGGWKDDMFHGQGKCTLANGVTYEGEWVNNHLHGQGKCTYSNGDVYIGQ